METRGGKNAAGNSGVCKISIKNPRGGRKSGEGVLRAAPLLRLPQKTPQRRSVPNLGIMSQKIYCATFNYG